jgi:inorganic pyrophosphatase
MSTDSFWEILQELVDTSSILIDRPKGSIHPRFEDLVYPLDYGYLKDSRAGDGAPIDVWFGSSGNRIVDSIICTIDLEKRDAEIKLLVGCTEPEEEVILGFHNNVSMKGILVKRHE